MKRQVAQSSDTPARLLSEMVIRKYLKGSKRDVWEEAGAASARDDGSQSGSAWVAFLRNEPEPVLRHHETRKEVTFFAA